MSKPEEWIEARLQEVTQGQGDNRTVYYRTSEGEVRTIEAQALFFDFGGHGLVTIPGDSSSSGVAIRGCRSGDGIGSVAALCVYPGAGNLTTVTTVTRSQLESGISEE